MQLKGENYNISFDEPTGKIDFEGSLRLSGADEYAPIVDLLNDVVEKGLADIKLDLQNLEFLNSSGISMLSKFVINIRRKNAINLTIIGSDSIPWQGKSLKNLQRLMPNLDLQMV
jgi:hypothetical protein